MKDRGKEEELRNSNDLMYAHLKDDLHVFVEAVPPFSNMKLAAGVAEIKKMIIPPVSSRVCFHCICESTHLVGKPQCFVSI